jgi:hypothetical protein
MINPSPCIVLVCIAGKSINCITKLTDFNKLVLYYFVIKYFGFSSVMLKIILSAKLIKFEAYAVQVISLFIMKYLPNIPITRPQSFSRANTKLIIRYDPEATSSVSHLLESSYQSCQRVSTN